MMLLFPEVQQGGEQQRKSQDWEEWLIGGRV